MIGVLVIGFVYRNAGCIGVLDGGSGVFVVGLGLHVIGVSGVRDRSVYFGFCGKFLS